MSYRPITSAFPLIGIAEFVECPQTVGLYREPTSVLISGDSYRKDDRPCDPQDACVPLAILCETAGQYRSPDRI